MKNYGIPPLSPTSYSKAFVERVIPIGKVLPHTPDAARIGLRGVVLDSIITAFTHQFNPETLTQTIPERFQDNPKILLYDGAHYFCNNLYTFASGMLIQLQTAHPEMLNAQAAQEINRDETRKTTKRYAHGI